MTDRDRITVLLERWRDVQPGLVDTDGIAGSAAGYALLADGPWKHPSYRKLERYVAELRRENARLARHLLRYYLHYDEVRRALCRVCGSVEAAGEIGRPHRATTVAGKRLYCRVGNTAPDMAPVIARMPPADCSTAAVEEAIDWLEKRWPGEVDLPRELVGGTRAVACATLSASRSIAPAQDSEGTHKTRGRAGADATVADRPGPAPSIVARPAFGGSS